MQIRHEVELAAAITDNALAFIRGPKPAKESLDQFWVHSKTRQLRWHESLKRFANLSSETTQPVWPQLQPLIEEILISEMPTRVWAAIASAHDRRNGLGDIEPVVQSVFSGHVAANQRALESLVQHEKAAGEKAAELNRLRHRVERWTDLALGLVMAESDSEEFAFDAQRAVEFFTDFQQKPLAHRRLMTPLQTQALCHAFRHSTAYCQHPEIHRQIATSIFRCLPATALDASGRFASLWLTRLEIMAGSTQDLLDQLIETCGSETSSSSQPVKDC